MSNFVVSARKYRPMRFDEIVGQEHVSQTLKNAFKHNHLAHAFLFCGPRGVGKTTSARILAKVLNCENVTEDFEPCNTCHSCESFNGNASFNITELDAASNNSVEHIRALIEQVRFQPQQGRFKIFIIDEVHMLSQQAFNAFLKTLEEPPAYAKFILATTEKHKIIPTILSRCQIFDFNRIQIPAMVAHLESICQEEDIVADKDALHIIAQKADGALRDSLSIFDRIVSSTNKRITYEDVITNLNVLDYDYYFKLLDNMLAENISQVMMVFDDVLQKGFEESLFINGLAEHFRNILVGKDPQTFTLLDVGESLKIRYKQQAHITPMSFLLAALSLCNDCDVEYKMARNKRLHVEMALIKMTYLNRAVNAAKNTVQIAATAQEQKKNPSKTDLGNTVTKEAPALYQNAEKGTLAAKAVLKKNETISIGSFSLKSLEADVKAAEKAENDLPQEPLTLDNVKKYWAEFLENIESPFGKTAFKSAGITLKDKDIYIKTANSINKSAIENERARVLEFIKEKLREQHLMMYVEVDEAKAEEHAKKVEAQKPMDAREIFQTMGKINPLIYDLRKRLDLMPVK